MDIKKGLITSIVSRKEDLPIHIELWNKPITYDQSMMIIDFPAFLYYFDDYAEEQMVRTTKVHAFGGDENNLVIYTENSIYNIKKIK